MTMLWFLAGLTGVLMAMSALTEQTSAPIASLQNINPYVETSLADLAAKGVKMPLPRQAAGQAHAAATASCFGKYNTVKAPCSELQCVQLRTCIQTCYRSLMQRLFPNSQDT